MIKDLEVVAQILMRDVHVTTPVRLAFAAAPWFADDGDGSTPDGVIHLADMTPSRDPDAPFGAAADFNQTVFTWQRDRGASLEDALVEAAWGGLEAVVQVALWSRGLDPTWPPCLEHAGHHPLRAVAEDLEIRQSADHVVAQSATWRCHQPVENQVAWGETAIPIGRLGLRNGLAIEANGAP
ncbi:hypothetical protein FE634_04010 [Nocardioides dongxiaopingii]|uniref:hypothetical protein n=1 Tax=Nocardioides sp. S-1144 TaxID=2582905 RepID=UPI00110ED7A7|nr:hypothetical protein [Nocardioides sp. S-1144]QCW49780.1 hypothetical protein FE634_04010 [Nocardioides sp. S-1144]